MKELVITVIHQSAFSQHAGSFLTPLPCQLPGHTCQPQFGPADSTREIKASLLLPTLSLLYLIYPLSCSSNFSSTKWPNNPSSSPWLNASLKGRWSSFVASLKWTGRMFAYYCVKKTTPKAPHFKGVYRRRGTPANFEPICLKLIAASIYTVS